MKRLLTIALAALSLFAPAHAVRAADKTPLASYPGEPNQPLKAGDAVPVAHGGTSAVTLTSHCVLVGAGTSAPHMVCPTTSGYVLTDNGSGSDPSFQAATGGGGSPGGSSGQIQYNNSGAFAGGNVSGDCTATILAFVCTKTNGVSFAASATTDTTSASNIGSGSLALARIAAISADNLLMNATGSSASPTGVSVPSCSDTSGQHLNFSGHAFSCGTSTGSASLPSIASGHVLGNGTGSTATAADSTLSAILDQALGSTQGQIIYRSASAWVALGPGTSGNCLVTQGASANPIWSSACNGSGGSSGTPWYLSSAPTAASLTAVSGDATNLTLSDDADVGLLFDAGSPVSGNILRLAERTISSPSSDWTWTVRMDSVSFPSSNFGGVGINVRDATGGKNLIFNYNQTGLGVTAHTNLTTYSSDPISDNLAGWRPIYFPWLRIVYAATADTLSFYVSLEGKKWTQLGSTLTRSTYFANRPNRVGIGVNYNRTSGNKFVGSVGYAVLN